MGKMKKSDILHNQKERLRQLPTPKTLEESLHFIKSQRRHCSKANYQGLLSFASFLYGIPLSFWNAYIRDQISPANILLLPKDVYLKKALYFIKEDAEKQNSEESEEFMKGEELLCCFFYRIDGEEIEKFLKGNSIWST